MHQIFFLARIYPYWAFPLALALGQFALYFRRRRNPIQWYFWISIAFLVLSSVGWVVGRGDLHSDDWVRAIFIDS